MKISFYVKKTVKKDREAYPNKALLAVGPTTAEAFSGKRKKAIATRT